MHGTALAYLGEIELGDQEWAALRALVRLATEHPRESGYSSDLIRSTAADLVVSKAEQLNPSDIPFAGRHGAGRSNRKCRAWLAAEPACSLWRVRRS